MFDIICILYMYVCMPYICIPGINKIELPLPEGGTCTMFGIPIKHGPPGQRPAATNGDTKGH